MRFLNLVNLANVFPIPVYTLEMRLSPFQTTVPVLLQCCHEKHMTCTVLMYIILMGWNLLLVHTDLLIT